MGASFEAHYAALNTKTKIRSIVLVTMLSLLLELVLIRWLASVFPVYSFYKNFTMLACFLGLGGVTRWRNGSPARRRWCCRCSRSLSGLLRFYVTIPAPRI